MDKNMSREAGSRSAGKRTIIILALVIIIIGGGYLLLKKRGGNSMPANQNPPNTAQQAGNQTDPKLAQLNSLPNASQLKDNLQKAGLDALTEEGTAMHIHQHLDIVVNGQAVPVPADIGIAPQFISPVHVHDNTGVIHVESPVVKDFKLGQLFDEWGMAFTDSCIGTLCADNDSKLVVAVNGSPVSNPREYVLKAHDEIEIWYGPKTQNPELIKSYSFGEGL